MEAYPIMGQHPFNLGFAEFRKHIREVLEKGEDIKIIDYSSLRREDGTIVNCYAIKCKTYSVLDYLIWVKSILVIECVIDPKHDTSLLIGTLNRQINDLSSQH